MSMYRSTGPCEEHVLVKIFIAGRRSGENTEHIHVLLNFFSLCCAELCYPRTLQNLYETLYISPFSGSLYLIFNPSRPNKRTCRPTYRTFYILLVLRLITAFFQPNFQLNSQPKSWCKIISKHHKKGFQG